MSSSHKKEISGRSMFKTNFPHFFKIILQDALRDKKLGIPKKFVRMYGNELSSFVILRLPTGAKWEVELIKCDGDIWLNKGWEEFVEYYDVTLGYFLVFEFQKNSSFQVFIFDTTASEIDYPFNVENCNLKADAQGPNIKLESDDVVLVENLDGSSFPTKKRKDKSQLQLDKPQKQMKTSSVSELESASELHNSVRQHKRQSGWIRAEFSSKNVDLYCSWRQNEMRRYNTRMTTKNHISSGIKGRVCLKERSSNGQKLTGARRTQALQRAAAFMSTNPFFIKVIQPSHISQASKMNIPFRFAKTFFKEQHGKVVLKDSGGGAWTVGYKICMLHCKCNFLASGWLPFARVKKLEVGDVCIFELINDTKVAAKVVIFRATEDTNCCSSPGNTKHLELAESSSTEFVQKPLRSLEAVEPDIASNNPSFKTVITERDLGPHLHCTRNFVSNMKRNNMYRMVGEVAVPD